MLLSPSKWFLKDHEGGEYEASGENIKSLSSGNSKDFFHYRPVREIAFMRRVKQAERDEKVVAILIVFIHIWIFMRCNFILPLICLSRLCHITSSTSLSSSRL